jgi:hypothetical protein
MALVNLGSGLASAAVGATIANPVVGGLGAARAGLGIAGLRRVADPTAMRSQYRNYIDRKRSGKFAL